MLHFLVVGSRCWTREFVKGKQLLPPCSDFPEDHVVSALDLGSKCTELRKLHPKEGHLRIPKLFSISSWQKDRELPVSGNTQDIEDT